MKEKQKTLSSNAQRLQRVLLSPEVSITIPLIALCIYTGIQNPAFLRSRTFRSFCGTARLSVRLPSVSRLS